MGWNDRRKRMQKVFIQPYLPVYLAGWVATTAWLAGVTMSVGEAGFTNLMQGLNTFGFLVSLGLRYAVDHGNWETIWRRVINPSIFLRMLLFLFVIVPGFAQLPGFQLVSLPALS